MDRVSVVLVEDHDLTRVGIRTALEQRQEVEVRGEAANATTGLQLIEQQQPDVAIVDIGLPDMDGIELTGKFKAAQAAREELQSTRILILTLQDSEEAVLAAFAAGADSYCMKDISFDLLLEALKATKSGSAWIDPAIARIVLSQARKSGGSGTRENQEPFVSIRATDAEYNQFVEAYPLTERELEVLQLIVEGASNAEIAEKLYITVGTVKTHVRNILNKLCADDRTQAAVRALRSGLVA